MIQYPTQYLMPFLSSDGVKEPPKVFGTGVLLKVGHRYFLLSAAHVFDQSKDGLNLPAGLAPVGPTRRFLSGAPTGGEVRDRLDVGFTALPASLAVQLISQHGRMFLEPTDLDPDDKMEPRKLYSFVGYPASKSKTLVSAKTVKPKPMEFALLPVPPEKLSVAGWRPQETLGGAFVRESMQTSGGVRVTAPEPLGMSGGGVWTRTSGGYSLVGLGIEWDGPNKMLIGTRIGILCAMIADAFPDTAMHLRQFSYLNTVIAKAD